MNVTYCEKNIYINGKKSIVNVQTDFDGSAFCVFELFQIILRSGIP